MSATLDIRVLELDDLTVVGLDGRFDGRETDRVTDVVDHSLARHVDFIVLDCSLLDSLDIEASEALGSMARRVHDHHGRLVMRQPPAQARKVLDLTGTSDVVEFGD